MRLFLFATVIVSASAVGFAQPDGSICVTVLDEHQAPVKGASVTAHHAGELEDMWPGFCTTGPDGACTMRIQGPGRFALKAFKGEDNYPDKSMFYFGREFKEEIVTLAQPNSFATVILHVGPKAEVIKGKVFDAITGMALVGVVEFHWVSDPEIWMQTGLSEIGLPVLVPANIPLIMVVSREGYKDWRYTEPDGSEKQILLRPGEERAFIIRLQPKQ